MKAKLSKRMLCAVFSLIMVLTSLPFTVFADEENPASLLDTAIENYESAMNGTVYKSGMVDAYNAYIEAFQKYDAYIFMKYKTNESGPAQPEAAVSDADAREAAEKLKGATETMVNSGAWTAPAVPNTMPQFENDYYGGLESECYQNILYMPDITRENLAGSKNTDNGSSKNPATEVRLYYTSAVVVYDGEHTPRVPIMAKAIATQNKTRYVYALYPVTGENKFVDSNQFSLVNYWRGNYGAEHLDFSWAWKQFGANAFGYSMTTGANGIQSTLHRSAQLGKQVDFAEEPAYANSMNIIYPMTVTEYNATINPIWYMGTGETEDSDDAWFSSSPIYMINGTLVNDAISNNSQKINIGGTNSYGGGGMRDVLKAYEAAMKFDLNSYKNDFSSKGITATLDQIKTDMEKYVNDLNNSEATPDPSGYDLLKKAILNNKERYDGYVAFDDEDPNTPSDPDDVFTNWSDFRKLYEDSIKIIQDVILNVDEEENYPPSRSEEAAAKATELNEFQLIPKGNHVDTNLLEYVIENAQYIVNNKEYFKGFDDPDGANIKATEIQNAIDNAKIAVWGSIEHYPYDEFTPYDEGDEYVKVIAQIAAIKKLIINMSIDFDAVVAYANNESLNSALEQAAKIAQESEKYANYAVLADAVSLAERFKDPENGTAILNEPGRQGYAEQLVSSYKDYVYAVVDAIEGLYGAFSYNMNGARVASSGNDSFEGHEVKYSHTVKGWGWTYDHTTTNTFRYKFYEDSGTFIRSLSTDMTGENAIDLRDAEIEWQNNEGSNGYSPQLLDSINLDIAPPRNSADEEIVGNDKNGARASSFPGGLTASTSGTDGSTTGTFEIYDIMGMTTTDGNNAGSLGTDKNGNSVTSKSYVWDDELKTTTEDFKGVLTIPNGGIVRLKASQRLNITGNSAQLPNVPDDPASAAENPNITAARPITYTKNGNLGFVAYYRMRYQGATSSSNQHMWVASPSLAYVRTAKVIDTTNLTALIEKMETLVATTDYTAASTENLKNAIVEAEAPFEVWLADEGDITKAFQDRYDKIWNAYKALQLRATNFETRYDSLSGNETPGYYAKEYDLFADLNYGKYTYESMTNLGKFLDLVYDEALTEETMDAKLQTLFNTEQYDLDNHTYQTIKNIIDSVYSQPRFSGITFKGFKYVKFINDDSGVSAKEAMDVPKSEELMVEAEGELLKALIYSDENANNLLLPSSSDAYLAVVDEARSRNGDDYNTEVINQVISKTLTQDAVSINGKSYFTYNYKDAITKIESELNKTGTRYEYTVALHNADNSVQYLKADYDEDSKSYSNFRLDTEENATKFHYGDSVEVTNSNGSVDWYCTVSAKGTVNKQQPKYLLSAETYSFNVRGDTDLYVDDKQNDAQYVKIRFIDNTRVQNTIAFDYVESGNAYQLSDTPVQQRLYYSIESYTVMKDGQPTGETYVPSQEPTFTEDTTLLVKFVPNGDKADYTITTLNSENDGVYGTPQHVYYNQLVTVEHEIGSGFDQITALMDNDTHKILAMGNTYSFYACQDLNVKPLTIDTYNSLYMDYVSNNGTGGDGDTNFDVSVNKAPVISGKKAQFVGSFAQLRDSDITITGAGIVLDAGSFLDTTHRPLDNLKLSDVNSTNKVLNLSVPVSKILNQTGNQFAVSIGFSNMPGDSANISYVAYISYKDSSGEQKYVYSNVVSDAVLK